MSQSPMLRFSPTVGSNRYRDMGTPRASGTTGSGRLYKEAVSGNKLRLESALAAARSRIDGELNSDERAIATRATAQAAATFGAIDFGEMPAIAVTDIGTAVIQWQRDDRGAMFSFFGVDEFAIAIRRNADSRYSEDLTLHPVGRTLRNDIVLLIEELSKI